MINFFAAIIRFFSTIFSPLQNPGGDAPVGDDMATAEAKAKRKQIVATVAILVIVGSLISLYFTMVPRAPKINRLPFIGLGQVLAEETSKAINGRGRVVAVVTEAHTGSESPLHDQFVEFQKTLKAGGVELAATESVPLEENSISMGVSAQNLDAILKKHAAVNAIVLLVGLPELGVQPPITLPARHPAIITLQATPSGARSYLERGIATVLILPRMTPGEAAEPTTPRGWFDKYFEVFTAKNIQSLPE